MKKAKAKPKKATKAKRRPMPTFEPGEADLEAAKPIKAMRVLSTSAERSSSKVAEPAVSSVERMNEAEVMATLEEEPLEAWDKLREYAAGFGKQRIYTSPTAIMFAKTVCYMFVRPKKRYLQLNFFLPEKLADRSIQNVHKKSSVKWAHTMKIMHEDQIEGELLDWVRRAFETTD